jgi:PAS domain S-box-containing protein
MATILIVDDERSIRTTLAEFIREEGHDVFTAEDATQALQLLAEHKPTVVITDIILPRMTGVSLLKRINETAPDTQVLMITGEPTAETAAEAVRLGAFDYLSKPIARTDFKSAVTSALRVSELAIERSRLEIENRQYREHLEEEVEKKTGALRASEEKYRAVVDNASEAVFIAQNGVIPFANPSTSRLSGRSAEDLRTNAFVEWVHPDDRELVIDRYARRLKGEDISAEYEFRIVGTSGEVRNIELRAVLITWEGNPAILNFASDITDRKSREASEAARQNRIQQRDATLIELAMNSVLYQGTLDRAIQTITKASAQTLQVGRTSVWLLNESKDAIECIDLYEIDGDVHTHGQILQESDHPAYFQAISEQRTVAASDAHNDPRTAAFSESYLTPLNIASMLDSAIRLGGQLVGVICFEHVGDQRDWERDDISFANSVSNLVSLALESANKRQVEEERESSERRYRNLFEGSPVSLWEEDCSQTKAILIGIRDSGVDDMEAHLREHPEIVAECIKAIRTIDINQATVAMHGAKSKDEVMQGLSTIIPLESNAEFIPQLMSIIEGRSFYEGTGVNQKLDGSKLNVAVRWIPAPGFEDSLERILVSKIDITAAAEAENSLQQALDGTIRAIGMTTETRDPYTAGHQRRVTELAVAIAHKMNLDPATIEGTRVAGLMHDIGKLAIPAEILSKPSALNPMEFSLIQSHPQAAYDILQTVTFPWPIAQIVLQHHERIDGTGYPNGLSKDDIMIEARILAVADTVEAMASHRPYRPALGINLALEEIEKSRGTKYQPEIVDACLDLFHSGEFAFQDDAI